MVFTVTTDLQRRLLDAVHPQPSLKAWALINGACIREDFTIDTQVLDLIALRKTLAPYRDSKKGTIQITIALQQGGPSNPSRMMDEFPRASMQCTVGTISRKFPWENLIAEIRKYVDPGPDGDETPAGNDLVKVYPVRTLLSRYLTKGADCAAADSESG